MISFAQNAEDVVLWRLFRSIERPGFYLDVGAGHPVTDSVTKWFSLNGWVGVNVEPVERLFAELTTDRPDDVNVRAACGAAPGTATLVVASEGKWGHSSTDRTVSERIVADGTAAETVEVEVVTVSSLIERHAPATGVDFLKIDVEGAEEQVIAGAALERHRPRVLVVEAIEPDSLQPNHERWEPAVLESGYALCLFDGLNRFYCRADDDVALRELDRPASILDEYITNREYVLRVALENVRTLLASWGDTLATLLGSDSAAG